MTEELRSNIGPERENWYEKSEVRPLFDKLKNFAIEGRSRPPYNFEGKELKALKGVLKILGFDVSKEDFQQILERNKIGEDRFGVSYYKIDPEKIDEGFKITEKQKEEYQIFSENTVIAIDKYLGEVRIRMIFGEWIKDKKAKELALKQPEIE